MCFLFVLDLTLVFPCQGFSVCFALMEYFSHSHYHLLLYGGYKKDLTRAVDVTDLKIKTIITHFT